MHRGAARRADEPVTIAHGDIDAKPSQAGAYAPSRLAWDAPSRRDTDGIGHRPLTSSGIGPRMAARMVRGS